MRGLPLLTLAALGTLAGCNADPGVDNGKGIDEPAPLALADAGTGAAYPVPPYGVTQGATINDFSFQGFVVLAVSLDGPESLADVNRVVHDKGMVFPVLLDQETSVVARYNPKREMPFSVLIDKSGSIVQKKAGYAPGDERLLAAEVDKVLR